MSSGIGRPIPGSPSSPELRVRSRLGSLVVSDTATAPGFWMGIALCAIALSPPLAPLARRLVLGNAIQFALIGYVVPPLVALGMSARMRLAISTWPPLEALAGNREKAAASPVGPGSRDRLAPGRDRPGRGTFDPDAARSWLSLILFAAVVGLWRLPPLVDALARSWPLALVEAAMLVIAGVPLWVQLLDSGASTSGAGRPRRMAMAAVSMWTIWVLSYMLGLSSHPMFSAYHHSLGRGLGVQADQQIAVGILWAVPGAVFVPVVFYNLVRWLWSQENFGPGRSSRISWPVPPPG